MKNVRNFCLYSPAGSIPRQMILSNVEVEIFTSLSSTFTSLLDSWGGSPALCCFTRFLSSGLDAGCASPWHLLTSIVSWPLADCEISTLIFWHFMHFKELSAHFGFFVFFGSRWQIDFGWNYPCLRTFWRKCLLLVFWGTELFTMCSLILSVFDLDSLSSGYLRSRLCGCLGRCLCYWAAFLEDEAIWD